MKKITMLAFLSLSTIGFAQNASPIRTIENKAQNTVQPTTVDLPAAYFNAASTTASENVYPANNSQQNFNGVIPFTGTYFNNVAPNGLLYQNGPYWNVAGNPKLSILESVSLGMNSIGSQAALVSGTSIADDFTFTNDVEISSIDLFAYQTGAAIPSITAAYIRIWDGDPSGGATVVWGDLTTNILDNITYADANRATETEPNDTTRQIQRVHVLTAGLDLTAGTYWLEYTFEGSSTSGPWTPPIVILGEATTGNGMQNQAGTWVPTLDSGTSTPQGFPFLMYGEITGGGTFPAPYCEVGYLVVEPITFVEVANISNRSNEVIDDSPATEDFTAIVANMR